mmetsp:Transcript_20919/g.29067  ORF Transcript_20919/g.29067 Transcript_20919/m.29067 type:complete len:481 (+) Transcript_20919:91-1533(+)
MTSTTTAAVIPSTLEVDYDTNITKLYEAITNCNWDLAIATAKSSPQEAQTWVVRHYDDANAVEEEGTNIMWRFLPIHSACARQPPASLLSALLKAYPDGAKCQDDQGMYPLHYACGNQASREIIRLLLVAFPQAAKMADPRGMMPLHYVSCWGPSTPSIVDMVMVAHRNASSIKDEDGNTPLDLALEGEYELKDEVVMSLKRWIKTTSSATKDSSPADNPVVIEDEKSDKDQITTTTPALTTFRAAPPSAADAASAMEATNNNIMESPRTVSRLRHEVTKLKAEKRDLELSSRRDLDRAVSTLQKECTDLTEKLESANTEIDQCHDRILDLQTAANTQDAALENQKLELESQTEKLDQLTKDHQTLEEDYAALKLQFQDKSDKTSAAADMYDTLNTTLTTMMETQQNLLHNFQDRQERLVSGAELRRAKLQSLLDFENQFLQIYVQGEQGEGEPKNGLQELQQQLKDMELLQQQVKNHMK